MIPVVRGLLNNPAELRQFREQLVPTEIAWVHQISYHKRRQLFHPQAESDWVGSKALLLCCDSFGEYKPLQLLSGTQVRLLPEQVEMFEDFETTVEDVGRIQSGCCCQCKLTPETLLLS